MQEILNILDITQNEYNEIIKKLPTYLRTINNTNTFLKNAERLCTRYRLNSADLKAVFSAYPELLYAEEKIELIETLESKYEIFPETIVETLRKNARAFDVSLDYLNDLECNAGLSPKEVRAALLYSSLATQEMPIEEFKQSLNLALSFGMDRKSMALSMSFFNNPPSNIASLLQLATINGINPQEYFKNKYFKVPVQIAYARTVAAKRGEIPSNAIYLGRREFSSVSPIADAFLLTKYPFDEIASSEIEAQATAINPMLVVATENSGPTPEEQFLFNTDVTRLSVNPPSFANKRKNQIAFETYFNIKNAEFEKMAERLPLIATRDTNVIKFNANALMPYFEPYQLQKLARVEPIIFCDTTGTIKNTYQFFSTELGAGLDEYLGMLKNNPTIVQASIEDLDHVKTVLMNDLRLPRDTARSVLMVSPFYRDINIPLYENKFQILEAFGLDRQNLGANANIIANSPQSIETKLKLAVMTRVNPSTFLKGYYMSSPARIYSRLKAMANNEHDEISPYLSSVKFWRTDKQSALSLDEQTQKKYPLDETALLEINKKFAQMYPSIARKLQLLQANYSQQETFSALATQDLSLYRSLQARLQRIAGVSESQFATFIKNFGELSQPQSQRILLNFYTLTRFGIDVDQIIESPKALKVEPEKLRFRLMLSRLAGYSDKQFLKRNFSYSEAKVFAKMVLASSTSKPCMYLYDSDNYYDAYLLKQNMFLEMNC